MNGDDSGDENSLKGFYAYKNTFDDDAIWIDIPKNGKTQVCFFFSSATNTIPKSPSSIPPTHIWTLVLLTLTTFPQLRLNLPVHSRLAQ